ncbi:CD4-1 molecule [Neolamprologus brichardi]|uniref:CD4-1 molecule n=1 Tax=Neolamprologus brichardi TaxID=32507 RepID=UPI0003EBDAF6|nr:CD4-1 molecule [Neolamprologus brichardi]
MKNFIRSLLLLIAVIVSTTGAQEEIYAKEGQDITLKPISYPAQSYVYWYFEKQDGHQLAWVNHLGGKGFSNDEKWKNSLSLTGTSLVIKNLQKGLFGTFFCKITAAGQSDLITVFNVIQVNVIEKSASPLLSGDNLSLTCSLGSVPQNTPEIYWVSPQGNREGNKGTVDIQARSEHNGQWDCVVKKNGNEKKFPVSVTVVDLAPVPSHLYTSTDSPLTIPCSLISSVTWEQVKKKEIEEVQWHFAPKLSSGTSPDQPQQLFSLDLEKLTWKKNANNGLSPVYYIKNGNLSLTKSKATVEDRGRYTCSMKFKNGRTLETTVDVVVLEIIAHPKTELIYGQQVNLSCSTGEQLPNDMKLNWTSPKTSSSYISYPTHITVPEVGKEDNGKWGCELWQGGNKLTSDEILLKIEPRLSVWMLVIICSAAVILLLLLVLAFIHYRRRKQKTRLLRHRLCQCKNPKPKGFYRT